ncbi:hypothetical protein BGZ76_008875 [Entomortierella beljakovae]|nr:hypothetical protein BGZ76_008875 [Entomortierella beljakovae]
MKFTGCHRQNCIALLVCLNFNLYPGNIFYNCANALSTHSTPLSKSTLSQLHSSSHSTSRKRQQLEPYSEWQFHTSSHSNPSPNNNVNENLKKRSQDIVRSNRRKRQTSNSSPEPNSPPPVPTPSSASSSPSSPNPALPSPTPSAPSTAFESPQQIALLTPQNQLNSTQQVLPFVPKIGANYSLEITPNVTSTFGKVEIRIGLLQSPPTFPSYLLLPDSLFPYSSSSPTRPSSSGTSAIRLAASEINANNLIPGAYITLVLKDSFNGHDPDNSGAAQAIFSTVSLLQSDNGVAAVIGDISSTLSLQSALLTSRLAIPQCSYSAGSIQLSNKDDYEYFFRTIPTELMFGSVMLDFVASRGWKNIAVFYTADALGSQMMEYIEFQAASRDLTIGYRKAFWEAGALDVEPALRELEESGQRIVIVAAVGMPQLRLMAESVKQGLVSKDYVWLNINQITEPLLGQFTNLTPTDLNGLFMFDNLLELDGYPPYESFLDKWAALDAEVYPYAGKRSITSNEPQAYSCMMSMACAFSKVIDGNSTTLHLLSSGKLGPQLRPIAMNANYTGPGGPMMFDNNGDVVFGNFILYNFQDGKVVTIGTSYSGVFNLTSAPMYFDGTTTPPVDTKPLSVVNPRFDSAIGVVVIAVAGLSILFSLVTMLIVIIYRKAPVIKASSPLFCCLELIGFILLYIYTIMALDIPTDYVCMARPFVLNVGFLLVVSNIVAKNFRIYRIFHNIYVTKRVIKDSHLLRIVGTIMFGNLLVMAIWYINTPPTLQRVVRPNFNLQWTCNNAGGSSTPYFAIMFVYDGLLLLFATYLAYMNRNVASNYNECRQIAFVVYNILLSGCLAIPTVFLPEDQFLTKFFLSTVVILFGTTVSLMFLFLPKLWALYTQIETNRKAAAEAAALAAQRAVITAISEASEHHSNISQRVTHSNTAWMDDSTNLAVMGPSNISGSGIRSSVVVSSHYSGGRKGSVITLDENKSETLKEAHIGYMGLKIYNRYFAYLSNWRMRRVALFPTGRYFTCFEVGKPETGRTFTYSSVAIHSCEPGSYILKVTGCGWSDFLIQVKDEERLLYWNSLFDSQNNHSNNSARSLIQTGDMISTNLTDVDGEIQPVTIIGSGTGGKKHVESFNQDELNESDQTLSLPMDVLQISPSQDYRDSSGQSNSLFNNTNQYHQTPSTAIRFEHSSSPHVTSPNSADQQRRALINTCPHGCNNVEDCLTCQGIRPQSGFTDLSDQTRSDDIQ